MNDKLKNDTSRALLDALEDAYYAEDLDDPQTTEELYKLITLFKDLQITSFSQLVSSLFPKN